MKKHELKLRHEFFVEVADGNKTAELRDNDRDFQKDDIIILREVDSFGSLTGNSITKLITHVLSGWGLKNGYVMLSFRDVPQ